MTATPYADQVPAARQVARGAAGNTLRRLMLGHLGDQIPNEIADQVLEAVMAQILADRISTPGAEGWGEPVHWTVYNAMHQRALYAGYALRDARTAYRKLRSYLTGFQDALDDMDSPAWGKTGAIALAELGALLDAPDRVAP